MGLQTALSEQAEAATSALLEQTTRVSQWAEEHRLVLSAPKSTVTLFISEKKTIQRDTTNHSQQLYPLTRKTPPYPGDHSRSSIHLRPTHKQPRLPHHPPPQHFKSSCWHQLGPAKRNNSHHLQIHHPIRNNLRCSHLVPQHRPHQHQKTTDPSEHHPPHCHWLREDFPHWSPTRRNLSAPHTPLPLLALHTIPYPSPPTHSSIAQPSHLPTRPKKHEKHSPITSHPSCRILHG